MITEPPLGDLLLIKRNYITKPDQIIFEAGKTAIFIGSKPIEEDFGGLPAKITVGVQIINLYKWNFIYNGEITSIKWYTNLPSPKERLENPYWQDYFEIIPIERYKNYALQKS